MVATAVGEKLRSGMLHHLHWRSFHFDLEREGRVTVYESRLRPLVVSALPSSILHIVICPVRVERHETDDVSAAHLINHLLTDRSFKLLASGKVETEAVNPLVQLMQQARIALPYRTPDAVKQGQPQQKWPDFMISRLHPPPWQQQKLSQE